PESAEHRCSNARGQQRHAHMLDQSLGARYRQLRIHFHELTPDRRDQGLRILMCANDQVTCACVVLQKRTIDNGLGVFVQAGVFSIPCNADDLNPRRVSRTHAEAFANRVFARPEALCKGLVNDCYTPGILIVLIEELASLHKPRAHGLKVTGAYQIGQYPWSVRCAPGLLSLDKNRPPGKMYVDRDRLRDPCR